MLFKRSTQRVGRAVVAVVFAMSAFSLTACSDDTTGPETGTDIEDVQEENPYDGRYDSSFYDDIDSYEGKEVTVSADVNRVITPTSFIIAGTDDTDVEPLLVVSGEKMTDLKTELTVKVTGTVHKAFDLTNVEKELDMDLDDELYNDWDGEPYIEATKVDTSVASDDE